jgi:hypothetical protein
VAFSKIHTKKRERHQAEQENLLAQHYLSKDTAQTIISQIPGIESASDRFLLQVFLHLTYTE